MLLFAQDCCLWAQFWKKARLHQTGLGGRGPNPVAWGGDSVINKGEETGRGQTFKKGDTGKTLEKAD